MMVGASPFCFFHQEIKIKRDHSAGKQQNKPLEKSASSDKGKEELFRSFAPLFCFCIPDDYLAYSDHHVFVS